VNRGTGTGFIIFGLIGVVVGAIMRYAVSLDPDGFDVHTAGVIILLVGIAAIIAGVLFLTVGGKSRSTVRDSVVQTPGGGTERVQERDDWSTP
jgi:hypothetical protein